MATKMIKVKPTRGDPKGTIRVSAGTIPAITLTPKGKVWECDEDRWEDLQRMGGFEQVKESSGGSD